MKKTALTLTIILALFVSLMVEVQTIKPVIAQFQPGPPPPNLSTTSPTVTIQTPSQLVTYNSSEVLLAFNVTKPQIWLDDFSETYGAAVAIMYWGQLDYVVYNLNGKDIGNVSVNDAPLYAAYQSLPPNSFNFSIMLHNLSDGQHSLIVSVYGKVYHVPDNLPVIGESMMVNFSVQNIIPQDSPSPEPPAKPESFPATIVFVASVGIAVVAIGLFVYIKKAHRDKSP